MKEYNKIIIAHYSPKNNCFVEDNVELIVFPAQIIKPKTAVGHFFTSAKDYKTNSNIGWVNESPKFNLEEFISKYYIDLKVDDSIISHVEIMLNSINKLPEGTPVAATYFERGILERTMVFNVHKVLFYKE